MNGEVSSSAPPNIGIPTTTYHITQRGKNAVDKQQGNGKALSQAVHELPKMTSKNHKSHVKQSAKSAMV